MSADSSIPPLGHDNGDRQAEELVAYLDGELNADKMREVEARLSSDDEYRQAMRSYQQSWDALDMLPQTEASDRFAATTVEMIAVGAEGDVRRHRDGWAASLMRQWTILGLSVLAACLAGFFVTSGIAGLLHSAGVIEDTNDGLLSELPVVENLYKYQLVEGDLDFLRKVGSLPMTEVDRQLPAREPASSAIDGSIQERREYVAALSANDRQQLSAKLDRFGQLAPAEQQQLRDFHTHLSVDDAGVELQEALDRYYQWYRSLPPERRVDLRTLPADERREYVVKLRAQQLHQIEAQRVLADVSAMVAWMEQKALKHQEQLLRSHPAVSSVAAAQQRRRNLDRYEPAARRNVLMFMLWRRWNQQGGPGNPPISPEEFATLRQSLSEKRQQQLAGVDDVDEAWQKLADNLLADMHATVAAGRPLSKQLSTPQQQWLRMLTAASEGAISKERLMNYYRSELTDAERDRFKHLSREVFIRDLRKHYIKQKLQTAGMLKSLPLNRRANGRATDQRPKARPDQKKD